MEYLDLDTVHEIDACISHFMFVNPKVHEKIGGWDESYFLYGEDIDFCYRVKEAGFKVVYMGDTKVLHYKGASVGRDTSKDIESAMNRDFDYVSIKGERVELKGAEQKNLAKTKEEVQNLSKEQKREVKKKKSTKLWFRIKISKESTKAMRNFYKKHYMKKYSPILTGLVFAGIWFTEQKKILSILLKHYLS